MNHLVKSLKITLVSIFLFCFGLLLFSSNSFQMKRDYDSQLTTINEVQITINGESNEYHLPYTFKGLAKDSFVQLSAPLSLSEDDLLYVKTIYSPADVYLDHHLLVKMGNLSNYPTFMVDPATEVNFIEPNIDHGTAQLVIDYQVPKQRNQLVVQPILVGSREAISASLIAAKGIPFILSVTLLIIGILFILIALFIMLFEAKGVLFFHLGVFSLFAGLWGFGESNLSILLIRNYTFLYVLTFVSLFSVCVPVINFIICLLSNKRIKSLEIISYLLYSLIIGAMLLQFTGHLQLSTSLYLFHFVQPLILIYLFCLLLYLTHKNQLIQGKRFIIPIGIIMSFTLLELINYLLKLSDYFSLYFQIGLVGFVVSSGIISGLYLKDIRKLEESKRKLSSEITIIKTQVNEQKKQQQLLRDNEEQLRKQRHDLKHHLTALKELASTDSTEFTRYVNQLIDDIPQTNTIYCENMAVNTIISYYAGLCSKSGIRLNLNITVPKFNPTISDSDLAIIFGNLLDNATYACSQYDGEKFINLKSILQYNTLIITMDNSFDGHIIKKDGKFLSSKRNDFGIGLSSIATIAASYHGNTNFVANGHLFMSNVYLEVL